MIRLDHINMSVENIEESISWYKRVFGFEEVERGTTSRGGDFAIIKSEEAMLCIYEKKGFKNPQKSEDVHRTYHFALRIKDRSQWEKIIKDEKVEIDHTWQYPHSYSWYLFDPSGHEIEVVAWNEDQIKFG